MVWKKIFVFLFAFFVLVDNASGGSIVEKTFVRTFLHNCDYITYFFNIHYNQVVNRNPPDTSFIKFWLYSASGSKTTFFINETSALLSSPLYNPSLPLVLICPGWITPIVAEWSNQLTAALLSKGDVNVVIVDYAYLTFVDYFVCTTNVKFIGPELGKAMQRLNAGGVTKIHMIGQSSGGHIAGLASKIYNSLTGAKVDRISALDPAGPCYNGVTSNLRLDASDAAFVDIIYTDAGVLGSSNIYGTATFFPNGGENQPGTWEFFNSHKRSWFLYIDSVVDENSFPAASCENQLKLNLGGCVAAPRVNMGYGVSLNARGNYFLRTGAVQRFGLGEAGVAAEPALLLAFIEFFFRQFAPF